MKIACSVLVFAVFFLPIFPGWAGRLMPDDLEYRGAFRLPGPGGENGWGWGGNGLACRPDGDPNGPEDGYPGSLFGTGHDWYQRVSEISIPVPVISPNKNLADLNTASTLQPFTDIRALVFGNFEIPYCGLECLPPQGNQATGKLYFGWHQHAQIAPQYPTHGWCELDLSSPAPAGPWYVGDYDTYSTTDYLSAIPAEWAGAHAGGRRLVTGRMRDGGQGGQGPCLYAIAPWQEGNPPSPNAVLDALPLLQYSTAYWDDPDGGLYAMDRYHHSDMWPGATWLAAGEDSAVIFAGTKGRGDCWYGDENGPCLDCDNRGWWSTYFDGEIIFFDPADLAAVAAGTMAPYEPQPYAVMNIDSLLYHIDSEQMYHHVAAAAGDREHGFLYVFEPLVDDDKPIVHVWKVGEAQGGPTPLPSSPTPVPVRTPAQAPSLTPAVPSPPPPEPGGCDCGPLDPPAPGSVTVTVSSVSALQAEIDSASGEKTIYLTDGTYPISGYGVVVTRPGVTIRSLSGDRDAVVIQGEGMTSGDAYFGVYVTEGDFTLADLTVRDVRYHGVFIDPASSPENFLFHNIRVVDCGEQLFKASGGRDTGTKNSGTIRCSTLEYTTTLAAGDYTNGIDILNSHDWVIQDNVIRNVKAGPGGSLAGPAILCWQGSSGTLIERNRVIDCDMGISFGNGYDSAPSHSGGIIRNNFVKGYANSDFGICVSKSPGAAVINNTIHCPGSWPYSIEIQYPESSNCLVMNNLTDEPFYPDRFGTNNPQLATNQTSASAGYYVAPASGDLHLASASLPPVDAGTATELRRSDIDCGAVASGGVDIGADEYGDSPLAPSPTPLAKTPPPIAATPTPAPPSRRAVIGDYDGDGTSDPAVYRPGSGLWIVRSVTRTYFGPEGADPVPRDFDGDGAWDLAWFRPTEGIWKVRALSRFHYGSEGVIPVPADYDGDGRAEAAWFDPTTAAWGVRGWGRGYFGRAGDLPVPGDYNGDGTVSAACYRQDAGLWLVRAQTRLYFGGGEVVPVPADYDGDGAVEPAWAEPGSGLWKVWGFSRFYFGVNGDPFSADFNGDGTAEPACLFPEPGLWKVRRLSRFYLGLPEDAQATNPY